jgi:hypothetical protein
VTEYDFIKFVYGVGQDAFQSLPKPGTDAKIEKLMDGDWLVTANGVEYEIPASAVAYARRKKKPAVKTVAKKSE